MCVSIRKMSIADYHEIYRVWQECNIYISASDREEEIKKFLEYNPLTSLVLIHNDKIIGGVLGGYDGRRGLVHHLCVAKEYRKKGYGKLLLEELEKLFLELGVVKISFWVDNENLEVVDFYQKLDYSLRDDIVTMSKTLRH